jgi:hypothetical protein
MPAVGIQPYAERDASGGPVCDVTGARRPARVFVWEFNRNSSSPRHSISPAHLSTPHPHAYTDGEAVALALPVAFHVGDDLTGKTGTLHITTRRLIWIATAGGENVGFSVPFQSLTMHAVSRDTEGGFPRECIYTQAGLALFTLFAVKTTVDDTQYGPCTN